MIFEPIVLSIKVALTATLFTLLIGVFFARITTKYDFPGKNILEVILIMPMVLPPSVTGYFLLIVFGRHGAFGRFLSDTMGIQIVFSWVGAMVASTVVSIPLMYQNAKGAFLSVDHGYERAARTLGASERRIFWTINFPLALNGILSGLALSFSRALGEFGATLMVAGNIPGKTQTIPLAIYFAVDSGDKTTANTLVAVITIFSFVLIYFLNFWLKKKSFNEKTKVN